MQNDLINTLCEISAVPACRCRANMAPDAVHPKSIYIYIYIYIYTYIYGTNTLNNPIKTPWFKRYNTTAHPGTHANTLWYTL